MLKTYWNFLILTHWRKSITQLKSIEKTRMVHKLVILFGRIFYYDALQLIFIQYIGGFFMKLVLVQICTQVKLSLDDLIS